MEQNEVANATDSYRTIASPSEGNYRELGSRFLSYAYPISSEEEAKEILEELKQKYHNARHICYAYRIGREGDIWRANDDGEPSSSAGKPILGQLLSYEVSDIMIAVVRYFGGTKLGIPGLIRAYRSAAKEALESAEIIEKIEQESFKVLFDYPSMEPVMRLIKQFSPKVIEQKFDLSCAITLSLRKLHLDEMKKALLNIEGVTLEEKS